MAFTRRRRWSLFGGETLCEKVERVRRCRPQLEVLEDRLAPAQIFVVTQATDNGTGATQGSLSWAIQQANLAQNAGSEIEFDIGTVGQQATITVTGAEPAIIQGMWINGYSQGGASGTPGTPYVELKGPGANGFISDGLTVLNTGTVEIDGLAIDGFNRNGISISDMGATEGNGDTVQGCYIGTDLSGQAGVSNAGNGIQIVGQYNTIGGTATFNSLTGTAGNIISNNAVNGIALWSGSSYNLIQANSIGVNSAGSGGLANMGDGIYSEGSHNTIGGLFVSGQPNLGNIISGNGTNGVEINGGNSNSVFGNMIGVSIGGSTRIGNTGNGVVLENDAGLNGIGSASLGAGSGNVISGNGRDGVLVDSPLTNNYNTANDIDQHSIGIASDGVTTVSNGQNGVEINSVIGVGLSNDVISGNEENGVLIEGSGINTKVSITGSMIGTNAAGTAAVANGGDGLQILSNNNTIGDSNNSVGASNVVSGNSSFGIAVLGGSTNLIVRDYIGTDVNGAQAIGNSTGGVYLGFTANGVNSTDNTIGGLGGALTRNVISGNGGTGNHLDQGCGIEIQGNGPIDNLVEGDYIGVDATGLNPLGNANDGIYVNGGDGNTIGGAQAGAGNVISANGQVAGLYDYGVDLGQNTNNNVVQSNIIGLNKLGQATNGMANTAGWQHDLGTNNQWINNQHQ